MKNIAFTPDEISLIKGLVNRYYKAEANAYYRFPADYGPLERSHFERRCSICLSILAKVDPQYTIPVFGGVNSEQEV